MSGHTHEGRHAEYIAQHLLDAAKAFGSEQQQPASADELPDDEHAEIEQDESEGE